MFRPLLIAVAVTLVTASTLNISGESASASQATSSEGHHHHAPILTPQQSGTTNRLQAISPVNSQVVWASGVNGTFVKTTDGGKTWHVGVVAGAETLQFRDVQGVSEDVAYLLSSGTGTDSRIYKTENGGKSWSLEFQNQIPLAFYDCFAFWTPKRGLTMSDSVNGVFPVIRTTDGDTWQNIGSNLPPALPGEGAFAASGTCVATQGRERAWIGTTAARILATTDGGDTWAAYNTPIGHSTPTSGIFSVDFRNAHHGILGGGDFLTPTTFTDNVARSSDGGKTWQLTKPAHFPGAIFGLSYALDRGFGDDNHNDAHLSVAEDHHGDDEEVPVVVATGPSGAAWTPDEGDTWFSLPGVTNFWAVAFASPETGWLVGTTGRILKISFEDKN